MAWVDSFVKGENTPHLFISMCEVFAMYSHAKTDELHDAGWNIARVCMLRHESTLLPNKGALPKKLKYTLTS